MEELLQESNTQQHAHRAEKQSLLNVRNNLQDELETVRSKFDSSERDRASLLTELQALRAVNTEILKYSKVCTGLLDIVTHHQFSPIGREFYFATCPADISSLKVDSH